MMVHPHSQHPQYVMLVLPVLVVLVVIQTVQVQAYMNNNNILFRNNNNNNNSKSLTSSISSQIIKGTSSSYYSTTFLYAVNIDNNNDDNTDSTTTTTSSPVVVTTTPTPTIDLITQATNVLSNYDLQQQQFIQNQQQQQQNQQQSNNDLMMEIGNGKSGGAGTFALQFIQTQLSKKKDYEHLRNAILILTNEAHRQREQSVIATISNSNNTNNSNNSNTITEDKQNGRIMLGICAENVQEGLMGLKTWVDALTLPRGLLHGLDVDGQPMENPESLGAVYLKYNTGGCMTFTEMRKSGKGFDALWKPGDVVLETYDGDYRGIYFNVELQDGQFRQFGVLPTDLFLIQNDDDDNDEDW